MRELKFRQWVDEQWHYWGFIEGVFVAPKSHNIPSLQFTGLLDSDHVEIWEGDIIKFIYWWFDGDVAESELVGEVIYLPELLSYALRGVKNKEWIRHVGGREGDSDTSAFAFWRFEGDDFHVIGNATQNPELLEP